MENEKDTNQLSIIAKLMAKLVVKDDKSLEDSVWKLRQCGMDNKDIAELLGISTGSASAHYSNRAKSLKSKVKPRTKPEETTNG